MTQQEQKLLMDNVFSSMMAGGYFRDQKKMASILKAIYYLLGTQENLSSQECDNCLLYFFQKYADGCSQPITDSYIRTNMIPIVKNFPTMNILGESILLSAKIN